MRESNGEKRPYQQQQQQQQQLEPGDEREEENQQNYPQEESKSGSGINTNNNSNSHSRNADLFRPEQETIIKKFERLKLGAVKLRVVENQAEGGTWIEYQAINNGPVFYATFGERGGQWEKPAVFEIADKEGIDIQRKGHLAGSSSSSSSSSSS